MSLPFLTQQTDSAEWYCADCQDVVTPEIADPSDQNYLDQDGHPVRCPDCGAVLGHAVRWPVDRDDSPL